MNSYTLLAYLGPEMIAVFIPVIAMCIPIVVVLTKHQQKMAELLHGNQGSNAEETYRLRAEVNQLRDLVARQTIALDDLRSSVRTFEMQTSSSMSESSTRDIQNRLGS
jgi:hypothetical protein